MLRLLQVINYMITDKGYTELEVVATFKAIQYSASSFTSFQELVDFLGIERHESMDMVAADKISSGRWNSALFAAKMRIVA